jgi:hypothetical protein
MSIVIAEVRGRRKGPSKTVTVSGSIARVTRGRCGFMFKRVKRSGRRSFVSLRRKIGYDRRG